MTVTIIANLEVKPDRVEQVETEMRENFSDTRAFEGCKGLDVYRNQETVTSIVLYQQWESKAQYQKYLRWRTESGFFGRLAENLSEPPSIRYYDHIDV